MERYILDVPFTPDMQAIAEKLKVTEKPKYLAMLEGMVAEAKAIGRPRALFLVAFIEDKGEGQVLIEGQRFTSQVLRKNLEPVQRVFPYLATCGPELGDWYKGQDDMLFQFWAEAIAEVALRQASAYLREHIASHYRVEKLSSMNPGSLADWPIEQQAPLFALLGDTQQAVGAHLTDSMLMMPTKSVSGILFPTEVTFASCQLCTRPRCPSRQAPYDESARQRYLGDNPQPAA